MDKLHVLSVFLKYKSFVYLKRKKCDIFCVLYISCFRKTPVCRWNKLITILQYFSGACLRNSFVKKSYCSMLFIFFRKRGIKEKKSTQLVLVKSKNMSKKESSGHSANNTSLFA